MKINVKESLKKNSFIYCKILTIIIFAGVLLTILIILSREVHDDLPTITTDYSQIDQFPAPVISMQNRNQFIISCEFLLFGFYGKSYTV